MELHAQIAGYIDWIEDDERARGLFAKHGQATVLAAVIDVLRYGDVNSASAAMTFVQDAALYHWVDGFRASLPASGFFDALHELLYAPRHFVRHNAIYTFGKLCFEDHAALLEAALPYYLEHDPLNLDGLLREMFWLSRDASRRRWPILRRLLASRHYLTRWAGLHIAHERFRDAFERGSPLLERTFARLASDEHPAIRPEAAFWSRKFQSRRESASLAKAGSRRLRRAINREEPEFRFMMVRLTFENYLWDAGRDDYDLALLDQWVRCWIETPWSSLHDRRGADLRDAYARHFHAWQARNEHWASMR